MIKLLYISDSGRVLRDEATGDFTTVGSGHTLACEMAVHLNQLRDENAVLRKALEEIASFSEKGSYGEEVIEVGIAKDALKPLTLPT